MSLAVINLGLKSIRCIVFDRVGQKLASASRPVHTFLQANIVEQDAEEWVHLLKIVLDSIRQTVPAHSVDAIAVTTSASCLVPVDESGRPTYRVMMVSDGRNRNEAEYLTERISQHYDDERQIRVTPDLLVTKMLWLKRFQSAAFARTRYFFSPADYLIFQLTGEAVTDPLNASKYLADKGANGGYAYPNWLEAELGVDAARLPRIASVGSVVGMVHPTAAKEFGLDTSTQVILTTYDAVCAVLGSGVARPGRAAVVSGTVTSVRAIVPTTAAAGLGPIYGGEWIEGEGARLIGGSNNLGGGLIEWHKQAFYQNSPEDPYVLMNQESEDVPPGSEGLIFLPYLLGERAPVWDPDARGVLFGIDRRHTRSHFTKAVFESVAFSARHIFEHLVAAGCLIDEVSFSGGLSRLPAMSQILADVLQRPVVIPAEFETTALGAYMIAATSLGLFRSVDEAAGAVVGSKGVFEPRSAYADLYSDLFELYKAIYEETRGLHEMRLRLMNRFSHLLDAYPTTRENL